ncbi:MAG: hypothetical protein ACRDP4_06460 [Nocardioidaceae bacterium]
MADLTEREEQQLRRALAVIGEEAGRRDHVDEPHHRPMWRYRRAKIGGALAAAAVVCIAVLAGIAGDGSSGESADHDAAGNGISVAQDAACSRIIAVGHVVSLRPANARHRVNLTFEVQDWIKPTHGNNQIAVNIIDPRRTEASSWEAGTRMLLVVPRRTDRLVESVRGAAQIRFVRKDYERVVSKPNQAPCPAPSSTS